MLAEGRDISGLLLSKPVPFRDLAIGQHALLVDRFDDGDGGIEIRLILFRREAGVFVNEHTPEGRFIPSCNLELIQGRPGEAPRYISHNRLLFQKTATASGALVHPVEISSLIGVRIPRDPKAVRHAKQSSTQEVK